LRNLGTLDCEVAELEDNQTILQDEESLDLSAQLLDAQMGVVLEFLHSRLGRNNGSSVQQKKEASRMALLTIGVFEEMTFMLHRSRHVQFIYFYICSLSPAWAEDFLVRLLRVLYDDTQSVEKRKQAQNYLGSIIVRGKFLSTKYTIQTTRYLIEWLNEQLGSMVSRSPWGVDGWDPKWLMFHQSVEVVLYVLCWKTEEFIHADIEDLWDKSQGSRSPLQVLFTGPEYTSSDRAPKCKLADVLNSRLMPTARICPTILRRFTKRMDKVVADQEWWQALKQTISGGPLREDQQVTDSTFAFDPFRLRNSHAFIKNIYRTWEEVEPDCADEEEDEARGFELEAQMMAKIGKMNKDDDDDEESVVSSSSSHASCEDVDMVHATPSPSFCPRQNPDDADLEPWSLNDKVKMTVEGGTSESGAEGDEEEWEYEYEANSNSWNEETGEGWEDEYDAEHGSWKDYEQNEGEYESSEMEYTADSDDAHAAEIDAPTDLMSTYLRSAAYATGVNQLQKRRPVTIGDGATT